jgi:hypothetical protein
MGDEDPLQTVGAIPGLKPEERDASSHATRMGPHSLSELQQIDPAL